MSTSSGKSVRICRKHFLYRHPVLEVLIHRNTTIYRAISKPLFIEIPPQFGCKLPSVVPPRAWLTMDSLATLAHNLSDTRGAVSEKYSRIAKFIDLMNAKALTCRGVQRALLWQWIIISLSELIAPKQTLRLNFSISGFLTVLIIFPLAQIPPSRYIRCNLTGENP